MSNFLADFPPEERTKLAKEVLLKLIKNNTNTQKHETYCLWYTLIDFRNNNTIK